MNRPELSWRDIQHIIANSAVITDPMDADWQINGAGKNISHKYGFGKIDGERLLTTALVHSLLPLPPLEMTISPSSSILPITIAPATTTNITIRPLADALAQSGLHSLEHVVLTLDLSHPCRGKLEFSLMSPLGTNALIAAARPLDDSSMGIKSWSFTTIRFWGEPADQARDWILSIRDTRTLNQDNTLLLHPGILNKWSLKFIGNCASKDVIIDPSSTPVNSYNNRTWTVCRQTVDQARQTRQDMLLAGSIVSATLVLIVVVIMVYRYNFGNSEKYSRIQDDIESPTKPSGRRNLQPIDSIPLQGMRGYSGRVGREVDIDTPEQETTATPTSALSSSSSNNNNNNNGYSSSDATTTPDDEISSPYSPGDDSPLVRSVPIPFNNNSNRAKGKLMTARWMDQYKTNNIGGLKTMISLGTPPAPFSSFTTSPSSSASSSTAMMAAPAAKPNSNSIASSSPYLMKKSASMNQFDTATGGGIGGIKDKMILPPMPIESLLSSSAVSSGMRRSVSSSFHGINIVDDANNNNNTNNNAPSSSSSSRTSLVMRRNTSSARLDLMMQGDGGGGGSGNDEEDDRVSARRSTYDGLLNNSYKQQ